MKGIIIAAGYGTRFLPCTKTVPKEMFPLVNKPAITFIIDEFVASGIRDILIVTSRRKKALDDFFDREVELEGVFTREGKTAQLDMIAPPSANIYFARQQVMRGTGDAILLAESFAAGEPVCVAYPDDIVIGPEPLTAQLMRAATGPADCVLGVMPVPRSEVNRYGIITPGENGRVLGIIEKPPVDQAPSCLATIGRYILPASIFPLLRAERERILHGEFYHVGSVNTLAKQGHVIGTEFSGQRLDVGEPVGYVKAILEYALTQPEWSAELRTWLGSRLALAQDQAPGV